MKDGEQLRDAGMRRVEAGAEHDNPNWPAEAMYVVKQVAKIQETFIADDVHNMADSLGLKPPRDKRAWGPIMRRAMCSGVCTKTGQYVNTERASRHAAPVPIYQSLVYSQKKDSWWNEEDWKDWEEKV
jgi:hypothetical protein